MRSPSLLLVWCAVAAAAAGVRVAAAGAVHARDHQPNVASVPSARAFVENGRFTRRSDHSGSSRRTEHIAAKPSEPAEPEPESCLVSLVATIRVIRDSFVSACVVFPLMRYSCMCLTAFGLVDPRPSKGVHTNRQTHTHKSNTRQTTRVLEEDLST